MNRKEKSDPISARVTLANPDIPVYVSPKYSTNIERVWWGGVVVKYILKYFKKFSSEISNIKFYLTIMRDLPIF